VGHFSRSAKFICMGKQKNRLTAIQTPNHFARIFFKSCMRIEPPSGSRMRPVSPSPDVPGPRCGRSKWELQGSLPTLDQMTDLPWSPSVHGKTTKSDPPTLDQNDPPTLYPATSNGPSRRHSGRTGKPRPAGLPQRPGGHADTEHAPVGAKTAELASPNRLFQKLTKGVIRMWVRFWSSGLVGTKGDLP
jgi:hypothetical protein